MIVVADSSPLIFLGKIRHLALIPRVLGSAVIVPEPVRIEIFAPPIDPSEFSILEEFLLTCSMEPVPNPRR